MTRFVLALLFALQSPAFGQSLTAEELQWVREARAIFARERGRAHASTAFGRKMAESTRVAERVSEGGATLVAPPPQEARASDYDCVLPVEIEVPRGLTSLRIPVRDGAACDGLVKRERDARKAFEQHLGGAESYGFQLQDILLQSHHFEAERGNLTDVEIVGIWQYTGSMYDDLNGALREENQEQIVKLKPAIDTLVSALEKLPDYQGGVMRGATLPEEVLAKHAVGEVVRYPAFTSTSRTDGFGGAHRFLIRSRHGKLIENFSSVRDEAEVLFVPGARFKVLERRAVNGRYHGNVLEFTMIEVVGE